MVAEQGGTNFPAQNAPQSGQEARPTEPAGQVALAFAADGSAELVTEAPIRSRDHHRAERRELRRMAEYLATRGRTPMESLHQITKRGLGEAIGYIRKQCPGLTEAQALDLWKWAITAMVPLMHQTAREASPAANDAVPGFIEGHFLAANYLAARQAGLGAGVGAGGQAWPSTSHQLVDGERLPVNGSIPLGFSPSPGSAAPEAAPVSAPLLTLPPKGRD